MGEGLQHLPHCGKLPLRANDAHRVILAHVSPRHEGQALGGGDGGDIVGAPVIDGLHRITGWSPHEQKHVIDLLGGFEGDLLMLLDIVNLEAEALVHVLSDD
ncbi:hypothetical protein ES703_78781 [subsurface metagenome]